MGSAGRVASVQRPSEEHSRDDEDDQAGNCDGRVQHQELRPTAVHQLRRLMGDQEPSHERKRSSREISPWRQMHDAP